MNKFAEMIKIAEIHKARINNCIELLSVIFPLNADKIRDLSEYNILLTEMLISRFSKLQDYLGNKIINEFLKDKGDYSEEFSTIDKLNKLEHFGIIENTHLWKEMSEVRNHVAHEYPNNPELTAKYLNQIFTLAPKLVSILDKITQKTTFYNY